MKKTLAILVALVMLFSCASAMAELTFTKTAMCRSLR